MAEVEAQPQASPGLNLIAEVYTGSAEASYMKSPMVPESYTLPFNPDDLWQKTGDYSIYEDMTEDDQVSICLQVKKDLILGSGFDFISKDEDQEEIVEGLHDLLDDSPLATHLDEVLTSYEFGFSLTEKIFGQNDQGMLTLKDLKTRHPNSWTIYQDDKGNITKYEQNTVAGNIDVNPKSLIHVVNNRKFQNPYGKSDLRACYAAWFAKRQVIKFYAMYLEKAASPTPVAKYDKNAPAAAITKIYNTIKKLQASTAMAIPKEIEVEFLESKTNGEAYSKAINIFNMFIGRSLFLPDLLGLSGSETGGGSYALGKEQIKVFFQHITRRRAYIENLINQHIIWPIVVYNWGFVENYPKFKFKPLDDGSSIELAKIWLDAVKGKTWKPAEEEINYFRSLLNFPEGDVEFAEPTPQIAPGINPIPGQMPEREKPEPEESEDKKTFGALPSGDYHKKVDFKKLKTKLDDYDNSLMSESGPVIKKIITDLEEQIIKKRIVQSGSVTKIDSLKIKYLKELNTILKASFMQLYKDSKSQAAQEILKGANFAKPLIAQEFLDILEQEIYEYIGNYEYTVLKATKQKLIAAIKDGLPMSEVTSVLTDDLKKLSEVSLERYARTKHTEVMNKGRYEFFNESGVVAAYQYSAIMDDRTSSVCAALDGKIFPADQAPIPPLHFNCRSMLIPITKYEDFNLTKSIGGMDPMDYVEENKGEGFATFKQKATEKPKTIIFEPQVGDPGVEFTVSTVDNVEVYTYTLKGKPFLKTTITYEDAERVKQKSVKHDRMPYAETV